MINLLKFNIPDKHLLIVQITPNSAKREFYSKMTASVFHKKYIYVITFTYLINKKG